MKFRIFGFSEAHNSVLYHGNLQTKLPREAVNHTQLCRKNRPYFLLISRQVLSSV